MARKSKSVAKHMIPEIAASLKAKAAIPITVTVEDTISQLAGSIQAMLAAGYAYADVAEVFKSHGVEIAASTIQTYHRKQTKSTVDRDTATGASGKLSAGEDNNTPSRGSDRTDADTGVSELESSTPKPNTQPAKSSSPQPTQAKSQFNVTDRSKL
jgi:hypothetical protein